MRAVLDASVAVSWLLAESAGYGRINGVMRQIEDRPAIAPTAFWYEARHALLRATRVGRLDAANLPARFEELHHLRTEMDFDHDEARVLSLATRHGLSFYDASYLETALRRGIGLATLDNKLIAAADAEGVPLVIR